MKKIIPAILATNRKDLKNKLNQLKGLTDWVQIDIMDGKFVSNTSITIRDLAEVGSNLNLETHLMVLNPEKYFEECQKAKIKRVIFHIEAVNNLSEILDKAKNFDFQKGVALNPETPIAKIQPYLGQIDLVLLLAVQPGFQAQKFIFPVLDKIKKLKKVAPKIKIGVDGGINLGNIKRIVKAGTDYLIVGSGLFKSENIEERLKQLKAKIK